MYTRSKSAWRSRRTLRGNRALPRCGWTRLFDAPGTLAVTVPLDSLNAVASAADADGSVRAILFAETWFHRDPLAPLGAAAGKNLLAALGLHARAKSVLLGTLAPVGLERTFRHEKLAAPDRIDGLRAN